MDATGLVHVESKHPFHAHMYKTLNLLYLDTVYGKVWFVVEGCSELLPGQEEDPLDRSYHYDEHSCPTNYVGCAAIVHDGNMDPHGIFNYVRSLWMTREYEENELAWIEKNFTELGVTEG